MSDHFKVTKDTKFFEGTVDGDKLIYEDMVPGTRYLVHTMCGYLVVPWYQGTGTTLALAPLNSYDR